MDTTRSSHCLTVVHSFWHGIQKMAVNPELNGLTLRDYLIKPVQRLCKYPLLMRVRCTKPCRGPLNLSFTA